MSEKGNSRTRKYSAQLFINAMPGTGGVISSIAKKIGCDWHTVKKYIDDYVTVKRAWLNERNVVTGQAEDNIVKAIRSGDLKMSKWWLTMMNEDFRPARKYEVTGSDGGPVQIKYAVEMTDDELADIAARGSKGITKKT